MEKTDLLACEITSYFASPAGQKRFARTRAKPNALVRLLAWTGSSASSIRISRTLDAQWSEPTSFSGAKIFSLMVDPDMFANDLS
jgi:hypothetical protein